MKDVIARVDGQAYHWEEMAVMQILIGSGVDEMDAYRHWESYKSTPAYTRAARIYRQVFVAWANTNGHI
tara:strand:- start:270 stop:476 length:207 start_codon:yes stop_codon:yes gene_type:complete